MKNLTDALTAKLVRREEGEPGLRGIEGEKEVRKGLRRKALEKLGIERVEVEGEEEGNLGEKRVLGFEEMRAAEAEAAEEAIIE